MSLAKWRRSQFVEAKSNRQYVGRPRYHLDGAPFSCNRCIRPVVYVSHHISTSGCSRRLAEHIVRHPIARVLSHRWLRCSGHIRVTQSPAVGYNHRSPVGELHASANVHAAILLRQLFCHEGESVPFVNFRATEGVRPHMLPNAPFDFNRFQEFAATIRFVQSRQRTRWKFGE